MDRDKLAKVATTLHIGGYERHVFLCVGEQCAAKEVGEAAWDALKGELKRLNLSLASGPGACYRTKVSCLRVCQDGPVAVVYPEGTYYAELTAERVPEFVQRHIVGGESVEEWVFARNPLPRLSAGE